MSDDAGQIRALIERWADAVHAGDLETVLADHRDEIVMFDVPPPERGVRGIDAYRATWPPFFEWQRLQVCPRLRGHTHRTREVLFADDHHRLHRHPR